ncbi:chitin-binding type-2 domain-containing protein [Caerostris darwini]|uniref:Chitin-binding type-2 domain-containing protein n=1 Tax=Caerostris darwini TaxID=1538125 RepID=A0AAV4X260_9ARAC|nr:chitin-binding type-2 domain-containing protein [Caerostris darwini]
MLCTAHGFTCPDDGHTFYHADVSSGCTVYYMCQNSVLSTFTCPDGQAFDHHTSQCANATTVHCIETGHHHKRSTDDMVHSISIEALKKSTKDAVEKVRSVFIETMEEASPNMYDLVVKKYDPIYMSIKDGLTSILKLPQVDKSFNYSKKLVGTALLKVYKSWKLSNATHINIVSFSDLVDDLYQDMKPVLLLARYLSSRRSVSRIRRSTSTTLDEVPGFIRSIAGSYVQDMYQIFKDVLKGDEDSLTARVFLPVIEEMLADEETKFDLKRLFWSLKSSYSPVIYEWWSQQEFDTPEGHIVNIPQHIIDEAKKTFERETRPILKKLLIKYSKPFLYRLADNTKLLFKTFDKIKYAASDRIGVVADDLIKFYKKHITLFEKKNGKGVDAYTLTEFKNDLKPIEVGLLQISMKYMADNPLAQLASFMGDLFGWGGGVPQPNYHID